MMKYRTGICECCGNHHLTNGFVSSFNRSLTFCSRQCRDEYEDEYLSYEAALDKEFRGLIEER
jgi:hypothetical protein